MIKAEWFRIPKFRRPTLAKMALIVLMVAVVLALYPADHVEKFGALVAVGFGLMFWTAAAKHAKNNNGNLAVLLAACGATSILCAIVGTPASVWAASALENYASPLVGGAAGFLVGEEE